MIEKCNLPPAESPGTGPTSELLILPDGRILVHNLTPLFAAVLGELSPADEQIHPRVDLITDGQRERSKTVAKE